MSSSLSLLFPLGTLIYLCSLPSHLLAAHHPGRSITLPTHGKWIVGCNTGHLVASVS